MMIILCSEWIALGGIRSIEYARWKALDGMHLMDTMECRQRNPHCSERYAPTAGMPYRPWCTPAWPVYSTNIRQDELGHWSAVSERHGLTSLSTSVKSLGYICAFVSCAFVLLSLHVRLPSCHQFLFLQLRVY